MFLKDEEGGKALNFRRQRIHNPLLPKIAEISDRLNSFRKLARNFYFEVILSAYRCLECGGRIKMVGKSQCACDCGHIFDPTLTFQKSHCCGRPLVLKTFHYACSRCHRTVPSRFLFNEKLFDNVYFREMIRQSRARAAKRKEAMMRLLAESRSGTLVIEEVPLLRFIPGLIEDLDDFVGTERQRPEEIMHDTDADFKMDDYRKHILNILSNNSLLFSDIGPLVDDFRRDRTWRFVTLIFMQNDTEVTLTQYGNDLLVERMSCETYQ